MEGETISVIIPAYNVAPWLPRCLDSVLAQTYSKLEIIVVDDGSADNTRQVMEDYAVRDGRIRPIFKENGGVTSARLAGVAAATGEWGRLRRRRRCHRPGYVPPSSGKCPHL